MVQPTYVFQNGKVYAFDGRRVIASASDIATLEARLADKGSDFPNQEEPRGEVHDRDGKPSDPDRDDTDKGKTKTPDSEPFEKDQDTIDYKENYDEDDKEDEEDDSKNKKTHVVTPNGLRGKILGRSKGVFDDQVTVKWDNGRITSLSTSGVQLEGPKKEKAASNPVERLETRVAQTTPGDRNSMIERRSELMDIKKEASDALRMGAPWDIENRLDTVVASASHELREIREAMEYLDTAEAVAPPKHDYKAATQADFGHKSASSWLDSVLGDMSREAEATDYEKFMEEGPTLFVIELNDGVLGDAQATRELAASHVRGKTAAANVPERDQYEQLWLERVEAARKEEFESRRQEAASHRQAKQAKTEQYDGPDEALFL